jgi:hydrogenase maturation protease
MHFMQVLIAGIGNVALGDDGFGVEVVRRLAGEALPAGVRLADFHDRGLDLPDGALGGGYERVIVVDAMSRGGAPGMVYLNRPDPEELRAASAEGAEPQAVPAPALRAVLRSLGETPRGVLVVGCEPQSVAEQAGLTPAVEAAVDEAVELVLAVLAAEGAPIDARQRGMLAGA